MSAFTKDKSDLVDYSDDILNRCLDCEDSFKPVFKYWKRKSPMPPDIDSRDLVDLLDTNNSKLTKVALPSHSSWRHPPGSAGWSDLNLRCPTSWEIYKFQLDPSSKDHQPGDGIIVISNPFMHRGHLRWGLRCLKDYTKSPPNTTNLDNIRQQEGASCHSPEVKKRRTTADDKTRSPSWWWEDAVLHHKVISETVAGSSAAHDRQVYKSEESVWLDKLRWATLGYHHNWDTKQYSMSSVSEFPRDLADLSRAVASVVLPKVTDYAPEASIVNFYPEWSTLSGHTDHSEPNRKAPLLSISFGRPAVFLIGGPTKQTRPESILLRSGDVLIMTEKARNSYHAVPRILDQSLIVNSRRKSLGLPKDLASSCVTREEHFCLDYLSNHRININTRQVF